MTPDERLIAEIELWQARAAGQLYSPQDMADIPLLIEAVKSWPDAALLENLIRDATDARMIASRAHQALRSVNREWAREMVERLDGEHAYVKQLLHNMRVRRAIELDREGRQERDRLTSEIKGFVEQRRNAGKAKKRRKWAELLAEKITNWDEIPESFNPVEIYDRDNNPLHFFRDRDDKNRDVVRCIDGDSDKEIGTLVKSSFEKRYLKK
ncbi:MAG: hypothetical protein E5V62_03030 [Mesorhizobium sp.]|uniref:hypothetical protein n=1 Tax=Mesorhizobium sp. TaxID=1871066 RepID=UPI001219E0BA|nr:hypothetical protein [Mesorhizobium sp.]TIW37139.1 MAG: hypothetical protein E5V62_03030 [Mesorhizobium sp.]